MSSVTSDEFKRLSGYYPLTDCGLLCFIGRCPGRKYEIEDCHDCPFYKDNGSDYFLQDKYAVMPINQVVEMVMQENNIEKREQSN